MTGEMDIYSRKVRGIPLWLLQEYLEELGGIPDKEGVILGRGWQALLIPMEPFKVGSLRVGQVRLEIEGSLTELDRLKTELERKLMRGGG